MSPRKLDGDRSGLPSGGTRIRPTDTVARRNAGLPGTGKVERRPRVSGGIGSGIGDRPAPRRQLTVPHA